MASCKAFGKFIGCSCRCLLEDPAQTKSDKEKLLVLKPGILKPKPKNRQAPRLSNPPQTPVYRVLRFMEG